ncbi:MAG: acyl-CoA dehydrogenase family protein [Gemmobacter sp.]|nr:acyl-CoA dehydrogenase family protein [Gemmobacter sp.]
MNFDITEEQKMMQQTARQIGERFGLDYWRQKDAAKEYPSEIWQAICDAGIAGMMVPPEHGGLGLGLVDLALCIEELCRAGAGATLSQMFMLNPVFGGVAIALYGTEAMKRDCLPGLCDGTCTFSMALTEPDAGTNSLAMKTQARKVAGGWEISGQKIWITGVAASKKMLIVARSQPVSEKRTRGISLFMVDTAREGITHTPLDKVGTNTLPSSVVYLDKVFAADSEVIGTVDAGWPQLLDILNCERIVTTAGLVGGGGLAIRLGVDYARDRKVFGDRAIGSYQSLQFPLAQHWAELELARLMNLKAASNFDRGLPFGTESNAAKLIASQAASGAAERAMQVMGGMGYSKDFHVERLWRDARLFRFAPVSEEMILNYISTVNLGLPRSY